MNLEDLSPLSNLKELKAFELIRGTIDDVTPLSGLDNLMVVSISSSQQIRGTDTFKQLPSLKVLSVSDSEGMSLSKEEWEERQMDIEGVAVNYNYFDRDIQQAYSEVMNEIYESLHY